MSSPCQPTLVTTRERLPSHTLTRIKGVTKLRTMAYRSFGSQDGTPPGSSEGRDAAEALRIAIESVRRDSDVLYLARVAWVSTYILIHNLEESPTVTV